VDWIGSHVRAFAFFGGVAAQIVSDNRLSGIAKACFYEPAGSLRHRHRSRTPGNQPAISVRPDRTVAPCLFAEWKQCKVSFD
jgi:transposase